MAKQYLLPNTAQHKANLHAHSTCSDGKATPEALKKAYKNHGYRVLAYTDHDYIVNHQNLNDADFIAITSFELSLDRVPWNAPEWIDTPNCHINLYAKDPFEERHIWFHPRYVIGGKGEKLLPELKYVGEYRERQWSDLQAIIDEANANGYLVCFNHPYWSLLTQEDYFHLDGLFAMEVHNTGCEMLGQSWFDYVLLADKNPYIAPVAADDNHNYPDGDVENSDSFGGFTMICTDDFSYSGILSAMERRDLYASTGICIREISREGDSIHCEFDEATFATPFFGGRRWWDTRKNKDGFTACDFRIPEGARYFMLHLVNEKNGTQAITRAFPLK